MIDADGEEVAIVMSERAEEDLAIDMSSAIWMFHFTFW